MSRDRIVRALLVGGPMYDGLYARLPAFEAETGLSVKVLDRLPHPELNARVRSEFGTGEPDVDLLSTHTKYAPSQAQWLTPLEDVVEAGDVPDLVDRAAELSRIEGRLLQYPRNLDLRLLYYRRDLFDDPKERAAFEERHRRPLRVPETWDELVETAIFLTRPGLAGFLFPGRDSGLFGTFYELLVAAGGDLFHPDLTPAFESPAGVWAADRLTELHHRRRVTPPELPEWHYDAISREFREGRAAMVCDWPGSDYLYHEPATCRVVERVGLALLPRGFSGKRAAYAGCHSFAIPRGAGNRAGGARLLRFLTTTESQVDEARRGSLPVRRSALATMEREAAGSPVQAHRLDLLSRSMDALVIPPRFAAYPACEDALWESVQRAITGAMTPVEAIQEAARRVGVVVADERERRKETRQ
jgi:multiple sugar transport system substrate-binding protein